VVASLLLAFLAFVIGASASGGMTADTPSSRYLDFGLAIVFAIPLVMLIRAAPKFFAPRFVLVDASGLGIRHGRETVLVPWPEIHALAIGFAVAEAEKTTIPTSADEVAEFVSDRLAAAASEALHVSKKRQLALEIFPTRPDAVERYPKLKPYWQPLNPPVNGLPPARWRFALPPVVSISQQIASALVAWSPQRWAGWLSRPWTGAR
jgi:hypothetical protein